MQNYQVPIRPMPPQPSPQGQQQPNQQRPSSLLNTVPQSQSNQQGGPSTPSTDIIFVPVSQTPPAVAVGGEKKGGSASSVRWSDAESRYLLAIWKSRLPITKKRNYFVWESISQELNSKTSAEGINTYRTSTQCKTRIKNMEDEFKRIQRDGKDKDSFVYYKDFAEITSSKEKEATYQEQQKRHSFAQPFQSSFDDDEDDDDDDDDDDSEDDDDDDSPPPMGRHIPPEFTPLTPQQCTEMMLRVQNQAAYDMRAAKRGAYMHPAMHASMVHDPTMMGGLLPLSRSTAPPRTRSSKWSDAETRYLLAIWKDRYPISKKRNYKVWESIAKEFNKHMASQGITQYRTGTQCKKRVKTLEDEFKKIKLTGKKPETFDYYDDLKEVFDLHKAMSGLRYVAKAGFDDDTSPDYHPGGSAADGGDVNGSVSKKRKATDAEVAAKGKLKDAKKGKNAEERGVSNEALITFLEESQKRDHEFLKQLSEQEAERDKQNMELMVNMVMQIVESTKERKQDVQ